MASESSSADSYIGSLISLTSKSEIRYEGVLYNINTDESSIGLRNVHSFGTEGRKQDGQQIPPSDKVYEYILFRGSDIKDLQVKSSPPIQPPTQTVNNDPAIIQSHYPQVSPSASLPSAVSGSAADLSAHNAQFGLPVSNFQGAVPLYQHGANLGSWGASPSLPTANGSGMPMPMYWQGYYAPNVLPMHQQSLLRPPSGLLMPPSMQHPLQYPNYNTSFPVGASNLPGPTFPESPSPFHPVSSNSVDSNPSLPPTTLPSSSSLIPPAALPPSSSLSPPATLRSSSSMSSPVTLTPTLPPATSTTIASDTSLSIPTLSASVPPPVITPNPELSAIVPPVSIMPTAVSGQTLAYKNSSLSASSTVGASNSVQTGSPTPPLSPSLSSHATHKDVEVVQISQSSLSKPSAAVATGAQPPILPLPARAHQKANGAPYQNRHGYRGRGYRGRGRGRGIASSRTVAKFTEEFDFATMNEKFNKEEVWGDLGKNNKSLSKDKEGDVSAHDEYDYQDEDDAESPKPQALYNKDDFFDTISCNTLNHDSNGRTKFSEQRKIDTETFGQFATYRGGRYRGRGNGYAFRGVRGRGRSMPNRASYVDTSQ